MTYAHYPTPKGYPLNRGNPAAYKDINKVMEAQKDLVSIKFHLKQVLNVKG